MKRFLALPLTAALILCGMSAPQDTGKSNTQRNIKDDFSSYTVAVPLLEQADTGIPVGFTPALPANGFRAYGLMISEDPLNTIAPEAGYPGWG